MKRFILFHQKSHPTNLGKPEVLEAGYDIGTVQELLGHKDVSTTMIYTHVMKKGGKGVQSPADLLDDKHLVF